MSTATGRVVLIGAGPGGPGLLTVAAVEALHGADIVLYDRLAGPAFRRFVRPTAELVDVGKRPGRTDSVQQEIIDRLISEAEAGKTVARVKGGSPFVFGRGFEEVLACAAADVAVHVIPGVTSLAGAAEAGGVPLTHRGLPAWFTVVSGHEDPQKHSPGVDWDRLGADRGPLLILMGVARLAEIARRLVAAGRDPLTPVAAVENATTGDQRVLRAPLVDAAETFAGEALRSPALIVVGDIAALGSGLPSLLAPEIGAAGSSTRGLTGWHILVPRSRSGDSELATLLEAEGADVTLVPVLEFRPPADDSSLEAAADALDRGDSALVAASSLLRATWLLDGLARLGRDSRALAGSRILATTGPARRGFERHGLIPDIHAVEDGRGLALVAAQDEEDEALVDELADAGWTPARVDVVRANIVAPPEDLVDAISRADAIVVPSSGTADAWRRLDLPVPPIVAAIGPQTADAANDAAMRVDVVPDTFDLPSVVAALVAHAASRSRQ